MHPVVQRLVREQPEVFQTSVPRSWAYAAEVLATLSPAELGQRDLVLAVARGYLPVAWATMLAETLGGLAATPELDLEKCFGAGGETYLGDLLAGLVGQGRTDAVATIAFRLRAAKPPERFDGTRWPKLLAKMPGDLRSQVLDHIAARKQP